jgi:predicted oxidoreductase
MNNLCLIAVLCLWLLNVGQGHEVVPRLAIQDDSDVIVSRVGMGTLHLGDKISGLTDIKAINEWILYAVDELGITLFDLANVYPVKGGQQGDSAILFGQALAMTPGLRERITIVAKMDIIFPNAIDTTVDYLTQQVNWFLEVLGTNYLDIMLLHYSNANLDAMTVAQLFADLKAQGKVKNFGVSNHYPSKFDLLTSKLNKVTNGDIQLIAAEFECSVWNPSYLNYDSELVDHVYSKGIHALAWGPLGGDPTGGLNRLFVRKGSRQTKIRHQLRSVGKELGIEEEDTVALLWLLSHPSGIIPLLGTTNTNRLSSQVKAFQYLGNMTNSQWWSIGSAGGLCALGDSQCNYNEYNPNIPDE